jgi:pilus assembly protein CpaB
MIAFAVVFGLLAVFFAQAWLNRQAELRLRSLEGNRPQLATRNVVVAAAPLRFGTPLSASALREVTWPEEAIPAGTFASIDALLGQGKRIVLASIEPNEPIIAAKITGPGQRATLSALIQPGMKAVTIRVNDVDGVGGFVLPGDHVDVLLTRQGPERGVGENDVVLQNAKILAVDQIADNSVEKPTIAKAVTLEADTVSAQKVALSASLGTLSLVLRKAGELEIEGTRRVNVTDLGRAEAPITSGDGKRYSTIVVTRPSQKQEYSVPSEGGGRETVGVESRRYR